jgi:hypothetical protein
VPEVEARIDLQQVVAPRGVVALEIHLEDAGEPEARGDVAAERGEAAVAREAQVRAVASQRGKGADLAADEPRQHLAPRRGEAVERPDRIVAAGDVFLEGELIGQLRHQRVGARLATVGEDPRLAGAPEELDADAGVVPGRPHLGLDEDRLLLGVQRGPIDAARHRKSAALGERLEARLVEERVAELGLVQQQREMR